MMSPKISSGYFQPFNQVSVYRVCDKLWLSINISHSFFSGTVGEKTAGSINFVMLNQVIENNNNSAKSMTKPLKRYQVCLFLGEKPKSIP